MGLGGQDPCRIATLRSGFGRTGPGLIDDARLGFGLARCPADLRCRGRATAPPFADRPEEAGQLGLTAVVGTGAGPQAQRELVLGDVVDQRLRLLHVATVRAAIVRAVRAHGCLVPAADLGVEPGYGPSMDFELSARARQLQDELVAFMDAHVYPAEPVYQEQIDASGDPHFHPPVMEELKEEARKRGPVEPLPAAQDAVDRRPVEPRLRAAGRDHGSLRAGVRGVQLLRARHREHGDPRHVRHRRAAGAVAAAAAGRARSARRSP